MLLTIDVGNTNTVIGCFEAEQLVESWRIKTDARATADEIALLLRGLLADEPEPAGIAACSTVPAVLHELRQVFDRYFDGIPAVIVEPGVKTGVPILYDNPREVGADRIVNAAAAYHLFGGPAVVVDFGTHSPTAPHGCSRSSWSGHGRSSASRRSKRCNPASSTALRARSTVSCAGSQLSWTARRASSRPADSPRSYWQRATPSPTTSRI